MSPCSKLGDDNGPLPSPEKGALCCAGLQGSCVGVSGCWGPKVLPEVPGAHTAL